MILLVDDDPSVTASLALLLKQHGYRSVVANGPDEALARLGEETPQLVIQDMNFTRRTTDASNALTSLLSISSSPPEADIEVDGNIAGRAPAAVRLVPGEHRIIVRKTGFSKWDKKISISPGETVISVDLIPD